MNVNWKDAFLQAQRRIDQVLDINPETIEVPANDESEEGFETVPVEVVVREPVTHPVLNNLFHADDIQTIVSSDIESIGGHSSGSVSPQEAKTIVNHEQISESVSESISYETIETLRKEIHDYKKANQNLLKSHAALEQKMEDSRFKANEQMTNLLKEERKIFEQELAQLQLEHTETIKENITLKETLDAERNVWDRTKELLHHFKHQIDMIKHSLTWADSVLKSDMAKFSVDMKNYVENMQRLPQTSKVQSSTNQLESNFPIDESTQTEVQEVVQSSNSKENSANSPETPLKRVTFQDPTNNVNYLLSIIESLENEKQFLEIDKKRSNVEIEKLKSQLNETLIMHGEKLEELEEMRVDNEDLKEMLKQQALQLTTEQE